MTFAEVMDKLTKGEQLTEIEKQTAVREAKRLEDAASLILGMVRPGTGTLQVDHMVANDAQIHDADIVTATVSGTMTVDGTISAGTDHVRLTSSGIDIIEGPSASYLNFYDTNGSTLRAYLGTDVGGLDILGCIPGESISLIVRTTANETPSIVIREDPNTANAINYSFGRGSAGGVVVIPVAELVNDMQTPGTGLVSGVNHQLYTYGSRVVFRYNDSGTIRYKWLDMAGTGVTWVHSTTPPP